MKSLESRILALVIVLGLSGGCQSPDEQAGQIDLAELMRRHVEASGGSSAFERVANMRADVHIVEPEFTVDGAYRATRDGRMRIDIFAEGANVFSEGIDRDGAWQRGGQGAETRAISDEPAAALVRGADMNIHGFHDLAARGHAARLLGRETLEGVEYHVVHVRFAQGTDAYYYFDPASYLVVRQRETSALHPDIDPEKRPTETVYFDFSEQCGIQRSASSRKVDIETGEEIQRARITRFECNVAEDSLQLGRDEPALEPQGAG